MNCYLVELTKKGQDKIKLVFADIDDAKTYMDRAAKAGWQWTAGAIPLIRAGDSVHIDALAGKAEGHE